MEADVKGICIDSVPGWKNLSVEDITVAVQTSFNSSKSSPGASTHTAACLVVKLSVDQLY